MYSLIPILSLAAALLGGVSAAPVLEARAAARTSAPSGAVVVDKTGATPGSYTTFQQGVDALSTTTTANQYLFIHPGVYTEQVYVPALQSNLTIQGYTEDATTYAGNQVTLTYNLALINTTNDDLTATLRQWNKNTKVYNLIIKNTFGHINSNGQNLAISAHTKNQGYYATQFIGYQDTILANTGTQLYAKCLVVGAIDFIFGQTAQAWFENNDIRTIAGGSITASGRSSDSNPSWYVINNSNVDNINSTVATNKNYLGRPWSNYARVVFQNTYLGSNIKAAGWSTWSTSTPNTDHAVFEEYNNSGPGAAGPRASFSSSITSPIAIETVLGSAYLNEWWVDASYL
ncbi:3b27caf0-7f82-4213-aab3-fd6210d8b3e8 [Sclerotinia trifoliorum]|uniref:Pectinesterase n=1 Tax=Sclerotinia trifoliorum TaxID=28548 RepID=A0A8H2ZRN3_9HELO|nr:3b27caf0-7f82-4213-aab3-fd6210d8b3e8 [Sclerotinia trifoliorum]